uniref:Uncharacterized protein n=1 Tax=Anopheles melas TaxID=34690 RepID=A0A182U4X8_9DIPT
METPGLGVSTVRNILTIEGRLHEGSARIPRSVGGNVRMVAIGGQLWGDKMIPTLEDSETDRHDEREERQLERVPRLQTKHTEGHRDECHSLQQDEHHDRDDDLLQLRFACLNATAAAGGEVERHIQLILLEIARRHGDAGTGDRHLEGNVVAAHVVLDLLHQSRRCTAFAHERAIAAYLNIIGDLLKSESKLATESLSELHSERISSTMPSIGVPFQKAGLLAGLAAARLEASRTLATIARYRNAILKYN